MSPAGPPPEPFFVDQIEAARRLGRPPSTLRKWRCDPHRFPGKPLGVLDGRKVLYPVAELEAYAASLIGKNAA